MAIGLAKVQCMIGIAHFQRYCVDTLILLKHCCDQFAMAMLALL